MPRYIPEQPHVCHVCGHKFTIKTSFDPNAGGNKMMSEPKACPRCGAPLRYGGGKDVGAAKNLVLTHYGVATYRKMFGSARDFLLRHSRSDSDIDEYVALVSKLDFAEWEKDQQRTAARNAKLSADERAEHKIVPQARAEAADGTLMAAIRAAADEAKAVLAEERATHLPNT